MVLTIEQREAAARAELDERFAKERREENARLEAERDARIKAEEDAKAEQRRVTADEELTARLKANYFRNNPGASEADYAKVASRLREEHMIREATRDPVAEEAAALMARHPNDTRPY
jgi:hypothetical protein